MGLPETAKPMDQDLEPNAGEVVSPKKRASLRLIQGGGGEPVAPKSTRRGPVGQQQSTLKLGKFTIGRKITVFQVAVVLASLSIVSFFSYRSVSKDLELMLAQRLEHIARTGTLLLDGEAHQKIVDGFMEGDEKLHAGKPYLAIHDALKKIKENNKLESDLYTLIDAGELSPGNMMFIAMAKDTPYTGNAMPLHPKVKEVLETGNFASTGLYTDHEGTWVSAFAPIKTKEGKTVAVMEVDYNAGQEVRQAKIDLIINLLIPAAIGLMLAIFLGDLVGRSLSKPIRTLADTAGLVAAGNLDVSVKVTTRDETGALGSIFNGMVLDLKRQREELKDYAQNLEKKVDERTAQLNEANRLIQGMVDSVSQGFFMFDPQGNCLPIRSKACLSVLGADPAGKDVAKTLRMHGADGEDFRKWKDLLFEGLMPFEELSPLGPKVFPSTDGKYVTLEYFPVLNDQGELRCVVVTATDRSAERDANVRAEKQKQYANMIVKFAKNKKRLQSMVSESKAQFVRIYEELGKASPDVDLIFRLVHTFKSASAAFSMGPVASLAHDLESELIEIRKSSGSRGSVKFDTWKERIARLERGFMKLLEENKEVLGPIADNQGTQVEIPLSKLKEFNKRLTQQESAQSPLVQEFARNFISEPIVDHFKHFNDAVSLVASRQEKEVGELTFTGGEMRIIAEPYQELFGSMIHIFRNAVDHGIETLEERQAAKKPLSAKIEVSFEKENRAGKDWIKIRVADDGRGIDPEKIRAKLAKNGVKGFENESTEQLVQRIFDAGFSTKDEVTDISGRGVGLDAVRQAARELGGECTVQTHLGQGTTFMIEFPEKASG